jgi:hypothetical protein
MFMHSGPQRPLRRSGSPGQAFVWSADSASLRQELVTSIRPLGLHRRPNAVPSASSVWSSVVERRLEGMGLLEPLLQYYASHVEWPSQDV